MADNGIDKAVDDFKDVYEKSNDDSSDVSSHSITIRHIKLSDETIYICECTTTVSFKIVSATITVSVLGKSGKLLCI